MRLVRCITTLYLILLQLLPIAYAEKVWSVFIFHRHGDRTPKGSKPPSVLTALGYEQILQSGQFLRSQYIVKDSSKHISGIAPDSVNNAQLTVSAPDDLILMNSAQAFAQTLYPPIGSGLSAQTLANGTRIPGGMDGYQLIPVHTSTSGGASSENSQWLQGQSGCQEALLSSNSYFSSAAYLQKLESTRSFYGSLGPAVQGIFPDEKDRTFKNAFIIFDKLNVARIHNTTFPGKELITDSVYHQLRTLADAHEYGLAFNATEPVRAISGSTLAAQILSHFNNVIAGRTADGDTGNPLLNIQFGAYGTFLSFFGLVELTAANPDFYGINDYASHMTFELLSSDGPSSMPNPTELHVRFLFNNGSASTSIQQQTVYPLFGADANHQTMRWTNFQQKMQKIAVGDQKDWCRVCGNNTGVCADYVTADQSSSATSPTGSSSSSGPGGISAVVAGVIGALVTLVIVLGVEGLVILFARLRLVRRQERKASAATSLDGTITKEA